MVVQGIQAVCESHPRGGVQGGELGGPLCAALCRGEVSSGLGCGGGAASVVRHSWPVRGRREVVCRRTKQELKSMIASFNCLIADDCDALPYGTIGRGTRRKEECHVSSAPRGFLRATLRLSRPLRVHEPVVEHLFGGFEEHFGRRVVVAYRARRRVWR